MNPYFASLTASPAKRIAAYVLLISIVFFFFNLIYTKFLSKRDNASEDKFWERESEANSVRKKSLDDLQYVTVPDDLPYDLRTDDPDVKGYLEVIDSFREKKMLNLSGYTNTDLKFMYGTANIETVSKYDTDFGDYISCLQKWADRLLVLNETEAAVKIMEYLISVNADMIRTYKYLGERYLSLMENDKFDKLYMTAENLNSASKSHIINALDSIKESLS